MSLINSIWSCLGVGVDDHPIEPDARTAAPRATTPATAPTLTDATAVPVTDPPRAPPSEGWLSSLKTWMSTLSCGFSRAKAVPRIDVYEALHAAVEDTQEGLSKLAGENGELQGQRVTGTYDLDKTSREENGPAGLPRGATGLAQDLSNFKALRQGGISLEQVKLRGEILLPNRPQDIVAIELLGELGGSRGQRGESSRSRPDTTGVKVHTARGGVSVENALNLQQLETVLSCNVKVGRIKLTGTVRSARDLSRLKRIVDDTTAAGGKLDLRQLSVSADVLFPPLESSEEPPELTDADIQWTLAPLQALKTHGARLEKPSGPRERNLLGHWDSDVILKRLRRLGSLVDRSSGRPLEGLRLVVLANHMRNWLDMSRRRREEARRLLKTLSAAGVQFTLKGNLCISTDYLERFNWVTCLPGLTFRDVDLTSIDDPVEATRAQAERLRDLKNLGATFHDKFHKGALRAGVDLNAP